MKNRIFPAIFFLWHFYGALFPAMSSAAWQPIAGIPAPPIGINEAAPARPEPWNAESPGFYYIDRGASVATDAGNVYGYPGRPRLTIPTTLPAGSVVEVHGIYNYANSSPRGIMANGTAENPVFIRGTGQADKPKITRPMEIKGLYYILENLEFTDEDGDLSGGDAGRLAILAPSNYAVLRHSELHGNLARGGLGITSYDSNTSSNVVIYHNFIHHNGDANASYDQDVHGIGVGKRLSNLWVVDNELSYNSGDGIQINAGFENSGLTHHIYVGRNISHDNKQGGFWSKDASDVIFSQNEAYGHVPSGSSSGQGFGVQYDPKRIWFIYNYSHDNTVGAITGSGYSANREDVYLIGNKFYNNTTGIRINAISNTPDRIINNTIVGGTTGIENGYYNADISMVNNIIANVSGSHISFPSGYATAANSDISHTLFSLPARISWGDGMARDLSGFKSAYPAQCAGCLESDPLFVDIASLNFAVQAGSSALDAGTLSIVYDTFESLYGLNIKVDHVSVVRPQGAGWDIGAYEHNVNAPSAPKNLQVR